LFNLSDSVLKAFAERARTLHDKNAIAPLKKILGRSYPKPEGSTKIALLRTLVSLGGEEYRSQLDQALNTRSTPRISASLHHIFWQDVSEGFISPRLRKELNSRFAPDSGLQLSARAVLTKSEDGFLLQDGSRRYRISQGDEVSIEESDDTFYKVKIEMA